MFKPLFSHNKWRKNLYNMNKGAQILIPYTVLASDSTKKKVEKEGTSFDQYVSFWRFSLE